MIADRKTDEGRKLLEKCESIEKQIGDNPVSILFSEKKEQVITYKQYVLEIQSDADDFLYSLAGIKGETIDTLKKKSVSDLMSFAERVIQENGRY